MLFELFNAGRFISRGRGEHPTRIIDSDELIYVIQGELSMFEDTRQFRVKQGEWLILRRGCRHGGKALYPRNLSFFWLHFRDLDDGLDRIPQHGTAAAPAELAGYLQNFLNEQSRISPVNEIKELLFRLILCELTRTNGKEQLTEQNTTPLAEAAQRYIDLHYMEDISLKQAAKSLHCNVEYLGRLFHQCFKESFAVALNRKRIEKAAERLTNATNSIKETASLCGFNDIAYFRRKFRYFYNQTPGEFRRCHSGGHLNTD